ncbi:hypothetical protein B0J12DRAFT_545913, partial [Macrophomina phaseolina]
SNLVHYVSLDEPRMRSMFGAPGCIGAMPLGYESSFPFNVARRADSPVAEEALAVRERETFFQLCLFM